ncbi:MAG: flagellar basal body-associated FliL family protein [Rhodanobacter sp.]|nr:MAG: flagellar basal body-associated FliL family protein [Rhodanobacter sp.]TAL97955.1 MAG: flagellar basal body-associated FliL family protein [Rhodanobacter sp.]TAM39531.1 MAG: flagellar basal body-associated FliL family protein [Rhodanobacter sp.]TAN28373.1 MAG: flagellar basal body-associated FliL family protein [Rhodanobacter sp.]
MVNDEQPEVDAGTPPKRRRSPLLIGGVLLVVLAVLGAGGYLWQSRHASHAGPTQAAAPDAGKPELYLPLEPAFVVTLHDGDALRYLQVGVTLMAHDQAAIGAAREVDPVVRDGLVSLFSNQKFDVVSEAAGREKLRADALASVRKIVQQRLGRPGIDALYFTSFVIQ